MQERTEYLGITLINRFCHEHWSDETVYKNKITCVLHDEVE